MTGLNKSSWIIESVTFFVMVATTALCLTFIFAVMMYQYGMPHPPDKYLATSFLIGCCVGIPTAAIASQEQFRMKRYQVSLESLASTDMLTGLFNRHFFVRAAAEESLRMARTGGAAGVLMIDIDHFKRFNDLHGHRFGDEVLRQIAHIVQEDLRSPFDRTGRWGGEEFVVLLNSVTQNQMDDIAERLRRIIEQTEIQFNGKRVRVTASFGCSLMTAADAFEDVLEEADRALYVAKAMGRNRVYSSELMRKAA